MINWIKKNQITVGIILLILTTLICFLPLSNQTGYYLNDWHPLAGELNDTSLFSMWSHERIGVGLLYTFTYPIFQNNYFLWQLFTITLRLIGAIGFYWLLSLILKNNYFNLTAAIIFLVYPGFLQQPIALTFSNHYIGYNFAIFSILFSILAIKSNSKPKKILFIIFGLLLELGYLFDYEYMIGYEVIRILIIWFVSEEKFLINFKTILRTLLLGLPNIIGVGAFLLWRVFIFKSTRPTTNMGLLAKKYFSNPVEMGLRILLETVRDFIETVWQSWSVPFFQTSSNTDLYPFFVSVLLGLGALFLFFITVHFSNPKQDSQNTTQDKDFFILFIIGFLATLSALLPVIVSDREVKFNWQMDRYTLHATFGVALFITGFIFRFIKNNARKYVTGFLIFVSVITHFNNTKAYVGWWNYERNLWWQLSWRAPDLKDGTQVIPLLPYGNRLQEGVEAWTPLNAIYRPENNSGPVITADVINPENLLEIYFKDKSTKSLRGINYTNDFTYPLLISYPSGGSCAHIIDGGRLELSYYEEDIIYRAAQFSQIDRIDVTSTPHIPSSDIFGEEPDHTWCYYYQTGSLLRQQENWNELSSLGFYILENNISPVDRSEWLPFLEGFLETKDHENANKIIENIKQDKYTTENLCGVWLFEQAHPNTEMMDSLCSDFTNN